MKRFLFNLAMISAVTLAGLNADASASGNRGSAPARSGSSQSHTQMKTTAYKSTKTVHCYPRSYCGWTSYCYLPRYRCYCFYDPCRCDWYYWSETSTQFLPIAGIAANAPTTSGAAQLPAGAVPVNVPTSETPPPVDMLPPEN